MPPRYGTRKPNRAHGFDYRSPGPYFVTLCVQARRCVFGSIDEETVHLSDAGSMVSQAWTTIATQFSNTEFDESVIMPNHFHALVTLPYDVGAPDLGTVIQAFKRLSTNLYVSGVKEQGWPRFDSRLWQRSYHDHIVRNEREMELIREYILYNPARWQRITCMPGHRCGVAA